MKASLFSLSAIVIIATVTGDAQDKVVKLSVNAQSRPVGTRWLRFGPQIFDSVQSALVHRVRRKGDAFGYEDYLVKKGPNLEALEPVLHF